MAAALGLDTPAVRVIAPDVGGGFGAKIATDRDTIVVAWAAGSTWAARCAGSETRNENLLGMVHGRAQRHTITIGGTRDGRILAYHLDIVQDSGAYPRMRGVPAVPDQADGQRACTTCPYCGAAFRSVVTNTTPIARLPRRRAAGGHGRDRAGRGPVRGRDRDGPGRGAAPQRGAAGGVPVHHAGRGGLRHRRLRRRRWTRCWPRAGYPELRAEQARRRRARGRPGPARHRAGQLRGDHRRRLRRRRDVPAGGGRQTGRPPCTPAAPRTARVTRPRSPCWSPTSSASRWTRSP